MKENEKEQRPRFTLVTLKSGKILVDNEYFEKTVGEEIKVLFGPSLKKEVNYVSGRNRSERSKQHTASPILSNNEVLEV